VFLDHYYLASLTIYGQCSFQIGEFYINMVSLGYLLICKSVYKLVLFSVCGQTLFLKQVGAWFVVLNIFNHYIFVLSYQLTELTLYCAVVLFSFC